MDNAQSNNAQPNPTQLIDRITYLASLVSEPSGVDPMLDKLRVVTAKPTQPSPEDIEALKSVQSQLEDYLVHREGLRSFTKESLHMNIERHFASSNPRQGAKRKALQQIILTILGAGGVTGMLAVTNLLQGQVLLAFFIFALFVGLAIVFQTTKKDLVEHLHGSLNYLMAATIGTGLFALNFPIIAANSSLNEHPMLQHGGFLIGAIPVYLFYYLAFYFYAKPLNVSIPRVFRPVGVAITAIIVAVVAALLPHPVPAPNELFFDLAVIGFAVSVYFSGVAAVLGFMAVPKTTARYSKNTLFLAVSMVMQTIGNGNFLIFVTFMSGAFQVNEEKGQILTAFFIMAALACQYVAAYKSKVSLAE